MVQGARPPSIFSTAGLSPNKGQADWAQLYSFILQNRAQKFNLFLKIGRIFSNLEEKNRDTIAGIPVSEWQVLVEDSLFGLFVEQMHLVQVESNLGLIAGLGGGGRLHAGGDSVALAVQVQISLSAHQFGNFHLAGDVSAANLLDELGLVVNVLGTDAEHNILADVIGQVGNSAVGLLLGHSDGAGAEGEGVIVAVLASLASMKFIWGEPMKPATNSLMG